MSARSHSVSTSISSQPRSAIRSINAIVSARRVRSAAAEREAGNYGVLTPFWDLVFGTFRYQPGRLPQALGVEQPGRYPPSSSLWKVLLPFRGPPRGCGRTTVL